MTPEIIIEILILFIGVYLAFFKSYLTEKGKSAALKEDISELTHEVEKVKNEFNKEHELLKTELNRVLSNQISYHNESRNAIISFYSTASEWIYSILEINYGSYDIKNINELISTRKLISEYYSKTGIAKSRANLLIENQALVDLTNDFYNEILKFNIWTDKNLLLLQQNLESYQELIKQSIYLTKNKIDLPEIETDIIKDEKKLKIENKKLFENYYDKKNNEYVKIIQLEKEYTKTVRKYLKE